jgi:mono/diheme cytochrome c family protein
MHPRRLPSPPRAVWLLLAFAAAGGLAGCDRFLPHRSPGEKLYRQLCAECHGLDARGNTPRFMGNPWADLRDDNWRHGGDASAIRTVIVEGVFGSMPAHPELSNQQLKELVDHLLTLRGETRSRR